MFTKSCPAQMKTCSCLKLLLKIKQLCLVSVSSLGSKSLLQQEQTSEQLKDCLLCFSIIQGSALVGVVLVNTP